MPHLIEIMLDSDHEYWAKLLFDFVDWRSVAVLAAHPVRLHESSRLRLFAAPARVLDVKSQGRQWRRSDRSTSSGDPRSRSRCLPGRGSGQFHSRRPYPGRRDESSVARDGLATDLALAGARLAVRIEAGNPILPSLSTLQGDVLSICARLADGEVIDASQALAADAGTSSLEMGSGAGPCELFRLASTVARLDDALNRGALPSGGSVQNEGFRYLQQDTRLRVFHRNFWLYVLSEQRRDLFERLQSEGVASDDDWLKREGSLEADLRLVVEKHRFDFARRAAGVRQRVPDVLLSRLCVLLPSWLSMDHPLVLEEVPDLKVLRAAGIDSFDKLSRTSPSDLEAALDFEGISRRDLADALSKSLPRLFDDLIWDAIAGAPAAEAADVQPGDFSSFRALVAWLLARLGHGRPREKHSLDDIRTRQRILAARIGEPPIAGFGSLQTISASVFGPSTQGGERARQGEQSGVMQLRRDRAARELLTALQEQIDEAIERAGGQLPVGADCPVPALANPEPMAVVAVLARKRRAMSRTDLAAACRDSEFALELKPANLGNVLSALTADPHNE